MTYTHFDTALIVGAGSGLSASLARALAKEGVKVALAARSTDDLEPLAKETGAHTFACDASRRGDVEKLFAALDGGFGAPEIVIYNASFRTRGPFVELDPADVEKAIAVTAFGAFLVAQQAARRMLPKRRGVILLTGASTRRALLMAPSITTCATWMPCGASSRAMLCAKPRNANLPMAKGADWG